ncbi:MAG: GGDEF domain-containing protein [Pseudomonadota bacterium]
MHNQNAWLDEVSSNPYADQLTQGFRLLRFSRSLEREYRSHLNQDSFAHKRIALCMALAVWPIFAALDFYLIASDERWAMLAVRVAVFLGLLGCGALVLQGRHPRLLAPLSLLCILALGLGAAAVVCIAHRVDPSYPYEGLLLICMITYCLIGLRFAEALSTSLVILFGYGLGEWLVGTDAQRLINNLMFLLFGNLIGAVGCYLLESKSREHFLISRLMRVLADRDGLTGLNNRRSFNRHLARLWRQAQREQRCVALLIGDVDHFKAYNDRYGHQAGDSVLQRIGPLLEQAARRPLDMAVRLGGEEFAVLLYDIDETQARQRAEELREALARLDIAHQDSTTAAMVTLSIGLACLRPTELTELTQLYEQADRALYQAKDSGRNRVVQVRAV